MKQLFDFYIFANGQICPTLQNVVVPLVFEKAILGGMLLIDHFVYLMENTNNHPRCNKLAELLACIVANYTPSSLVPKYHEQLPGQFLAEVICAKDELVEDRIWLNDGRALDLCRFHEHPPQDVVVVKGQADKRSSSPFSS